MWRCYKKGVVRANDDVVEKANYIHGDAIKESVSRKTKTGHCVEKRVPDRVEIPVELALSILVLILK